MTRRITRAKQTLRDGGARFACPSAEERPARTRVVLHALYLLFTEGYVEHRGRGL